MIIVIDYDAGNTANVLRSLEKIGVTAELSADKEKILAADGLILPGVGAYPTAMAELERRGLVAVIKEAVAKGVPLLGICSVLGNMSSLFSSSTIRTSRFQT